MKVILVIFTLVILSHQKGVRKLKQNSFEIDDFLNGNFTANYWNGTWISDSVFHYMNLDGDLMKYDMFTKKPDLFLESEKMESYPDPVLIVSPDLLFVVLKYNISEDSSLSSNTIYDIANKKYYDVENKTHIKFLEFAPEGHSFVYILDNNIYYVKDIPADIEKPLAITTEGIPGVVFCGTYDLSFEDDDEISAMWFSENGTHLAYVVFHEERVQNMSYTVYGKPGDLRDQYPHEIVIKYAKAGTTIATVNIYLYDLNSKIIVELQLPPTTFTNNSTEYVFVDFSWITVSEVVVVVKNRVKNKTHIIRCLINGTCKEETSRKETNGWIETSILMYNENGTKRLEILPQPEDDDRFDHLVLTDITSNTQIRLTHGKLSVLSLVAWDEETGLIYYTATAENTPFNINAYSTDQSGNVECITCSMKVDNVSCGNGAVYFSNSLSFYAKECRGPNVPLITLEKTNDVNHSLIWEDNNELKAALAYKSRPIIKNLLVPINDQFSARVRLYLPPNINEASNRKYPAIVETYGGPGDNQITDEFNIDYKYYLVTNKKYIYIYIDGRGSGKDGYNKLFQVYRKLGTVEVEDQIHVTKYLQDNLPYIDAKRTGIWGSSFGGFSSSWALAKDKDHVFKAAIAVAPVTNFLYYFSMYSEAYMGLPTPEDNEEGYKNTDLARAVDAFRGRQYFIIHGTGDNNVHYQHSMLFVKALQTASIQFRQHAYPDEGHSLENVFSHFYRMMTLYWIEQFDIFKSNCIVRRT